MSLLRESVKDTPLFDYLEEKTNEEVASKLASKEVSSVRKLYLANFALFSFLILSIAGMFYVQFKVDNLQDKITLVQGQIDDYNDEIKLLAVEWHYLTRPSRLRSLAQKYLKENKVIKYDQVKDYDNLRQFYLANARRRNRLALSD